VAVTEPPWLNKSGGVAARNGTTSRTITFSTDGDAPFTPTNGSLLVFLCFGGVTHTVSVGGWTEQLSPVNSGELSVFTVTAASHTTIAITHNGSNYPVNWLAYEFASGSTWTNGTGQSVADVDNQTWPALGSLPGTDQVVIAARGQAQGPTGGPPAGTWSAPWVEDYKQSTAHNGATDGCWMHVGRQINVTATSVTPTSTYSSTNTVNNIQQVVFALNVVQASTWTYGYEARIG
jgi:hypothetical protein